MKLIREPWTERVRVKLLRAMLWLTETTQRRGTTTPAALDALRERLTWVLLTQLDTQIGTSPASRDPSCTATSDDDDTAQHTSQTSASMVITVEPMSVRTTYYQGT